MVLLEVLDPRCGERAHGPRADGVDADALGPEVHREIAHDRLQGGLRDAHHVVVGDHLLGAVVGQREHAAALRHERLRGPGERDERVRRDVHGEGEAIAGGVREVPVELLPLRERDAVDEDVERAVARLPGAEHASDVVVALDVARLHEVRADARRERLDPLLDEHLGGAEPHRRALLMERLGDAPCDGVVVGHPEDERLASVQQSHRSPPSCDR